MTIIYENFHFKFNNMWNIIFMNACLFCQIFDRFTVNRRHIFHTNIFLENEKFSWILLKIEYKKCLQCYPHHSYEQTKRSAIIIYIGIVTPKSEFHRYILVNYIRIFQTIFFIDFKKYSIIIQHGTVIKLQQSICIKLNIFEKNTVM